MRKVHKSFPVRGRVFDHRPDQEAFNIWGQTSGRWAMIFNPIEERDMMATRGAKVSNQRCVLYLLEELQLADHCSECPSWSRSRGFDLARINLGQRFYMSKVARVALWQPIDRGFPLLVEERRVRPTKGISQVCQGSQSLRITWQDQPRWRLNHF